MTDKQIVAKASKRAKTRAELGISPHKARSLESEGLPKRVGFRQVGTQGRPAVEYLKAA